MNNRLNSGNTQTDNAVGNPERSRLETERATTIPKGSTSKQREIDGTQKGYDIVSSNRKLLAVKTCKKCLITKDISEFYKGSGRLCKKCYKGKVKEYSQTDKAKELRSTRIKIWNECHIDLVRSYKKKYKKSDKGKESESRYRVSRMKRNPNKVRARRLINTWKKRGKIEVPAYCEKCGNHSPLEAHHENYDNPSVVIWLCHDCHVLAGQK